MLQYKLKSLQQIKIMITDKFNKNYKESLFIQQMRGIQINNYFNNHISLNGKKINPDNPTTIVHTHRPQPLVIDHVHPSNSPQPMIISQTKSPHLKPQYSNRKKRTNTIILTQCKKQKKQKKSLSLQHLKKGSHSAAKKKSNESSTEKYQEKPVNSSCKKIKPSLSKVQKSQGLGKRSKSAIIRHPHQYSDPMKDASSKNLKKQKKSVIIGGEPQSSKNSSKRLVKKTIQIDTSQSIKQKQSKITKVPSAIIKSKKISQKVVSELKCNKFQTQKKSARTAVSKSYHTSAKQSKPVSARDKKIKKKLFSKEKYPQNIDDFELLRDKFQNQLIKQNIGGQKQEEQVSDIVNQLQGVLAKLSSKKSLKAQLKKITQKLKIISSNQASQQQQSEGQNDFKQSKQPNDNQFRKVKQFKPSQIGIQKKSYGGVSHKQKIEFDHKKKQKLQQKYDIGQSSLIRSRFNNEQKSDQQEFQQIYDQKYDDLQNELENYDNQAIHQKIQHLKQNNKYLQILRQESNSHQKNYQSIDPRQNPRQFKVEQQNSDQQIANSIEDINAYLNNNQIPKQAGDNKNQNKSKNKKAQQINYNSNNNKNNQESSNPLLQRRLIKNDIAHNMMEALEYVSIESYAGQEEKSQEEKKRQIQSLKQFMKESNKMMEKINKVQEKKKLTIQIKDTHSNSHAETNLSKSPVSLEHKYDDRYPHLMKSPKFSDIQITNILSLKQTCAVSKNSKMNELIKKMYERQLVSPKSYEYSMYQLKKQFDQQNQILDGFKKHAEQFSQILSEIRKDKDDIKDIQQLIKNQKWDQARNYMKENSIRGNKSFKKKENVLQGKTKNIKEEDLQGWEKVIVGQQSQKREQIPIIVNVSPQRQRIGVVQSNINLTIQPTSLSKKNKQSLSLNQSLSQSLKKQKEPLNQKYHFKNVQNKKQNHKSQSSESQHLLNDSDGSSGIVQQLDFQIPAEHHLRRPSDEPLVILNRQTKLTDSNLSDEAQRYLSAEKVVDDLEDFQDYVYYQGEDSESNSLDNKSGLSVNGQKNLKQQGLFKLVQVDNSNQNNQQSEDKSDGALAVYSIEHEEQEYPSSISRQSKQSIIHIVADDDQDLFPNIEEKSNITKKKQGSAQVLSISEPEPPLQDSETDSVIQLSSKKGFQSNLFFIKEYCISLCEYVRDHEQIKQKFKSNIQQPAQFEMIELLKQYRTTLEGDYNNEYNSMKNQLVYYKNFRKINEKAISPELADQFNKSYPSLKYYNLDLNQKGKEKFKLQKQTEIIFLKAICEVLNQTLDIERPGGIHGKPLLWANDPKHLKNMKYLYNDKQKRKIDLDSEAETYDFIFGTAISRIIQWGSILCGFLPDTAQLQNTQIDQQYVTHIRQSRMAFILQKMLAQEQATINNSQLQEGQVLLSLGRQIMQQLFEQAAEQIKLLGYKH